MSKALTANELRGLSREKAFKEQIKRARSS